MLTERQIVRVRNWMMAVTVPVYFWVFTVMDEALFSWWTLLFNAVAAFVVAAYITAWLGPMLIEYLEKTLPRANPLAAAPGSAGGHATGNSECRPERRVLPPGQKAAARARLSL